MTARFTVFDPTNAADLVTLRERPWFHCPLHDERVAKDEWIWAWCPSCGAEDRAEYEARQATVEDARVRRIVREMLQERKQ